MAEVWYPHTDYNYGTVTENEYAGGIGWNTPSGLIGTPSDPLPLLLSGGTVYLRAGTAARLAGMAYLVEDADLPLTIADNPAGAPRHDHVVIQLDWETMEIHAVVKEGVPGGSLPAVTQQRGQGVFEISAGQVTVPAASTVASATLTRRGWYVSPDGRLLCTVDSRPPHAPGRTVWETDTGRLLVSDGTSWQRAVDNGALASASMASGYSATRNVIHVRNGWAHVQLACQRNAAMAADVMHHVATIPAGCRPPYHVYSTGVVAGLQQVVWVIWESGGAVRVHPGHVSIGSGRVVYLSAVAWPVA